MVYIWGIGGYLNFPNLTTAISFGNGYFVVVALGGEIIYTSNLSLPWQLSNSIPHSPLNLPATQMNAITYGSDTGFVTVGNGAYAASNLIGNQLMIQSNVDIGRGTIRSNPAGIDCAITGNCIGFYDNNTIVTLNAVPHALASPPYTQYYFTGWSGGGCDGNVSLTCKVTMDADKTVTANFSTTPPVSATWAKTTAAPSIDEVTSNPADLRRGLHRGRPNMDWRRKF